MARKIKFVFNDAANLNAPPSAPGLIFAVRTDANFATDTLKQNIVKALVERGADPQTAAADTTRVVHEAYRKWGHRVLNSIVSHLDFSQYDLPSQNPSPVHVHFYNAAQLADQTKILADNLVQAHNKGKNIPGYYISLDDLIGKQGEHSGELAFSRLFSLDGKQQHGYMARPGYDSLDKQLEHIRSDLQTLKNRYGRPVPIVLLEDNVRHAKMLNWVIDLMDQHMIFSYGKLAGISTAFCCATQAERNAIKYKGKTVPLAVVADYKSLPVDVKTPRDLLFDGFVVEVGGRVTRLPGVFMDVAKLFKIKPDQAEDFREKIFKENRTFCRTVEKELNIGLPLAWFVGAEAMQHVIPMTYIMKAKP